MVSTTPETIDAAATCANCGTRESDGTKLKTCNACKMERYCCRDCQVSHWPRHKEACKKRAAELFDKELFKDPPEREECPICMLPFSNDKNSSVFYLCCGTYICSGCIHAQFKEDANSGKEFEECLACPFCRTPATAEKKEHIRRLNKNVERNHAPSIHQLAVNYLPGVEGFIVEGWGKDIAKAIELFEQSGRLGYADSYNYLGLIYWDGRDGVERDIKKARYYLEHGAIGGSIKARHNLACFDLKESLGDSDCDDGDLKRAFKHYLICAKAGMKESLETLKVGCKEGWITKDEYVVALRAYQKQQEDKRSETRDKASGFGDSQLEWKRYYHYLRAMRGDLSSLYQFACIDWDIGNFSEACKAFLHCAKAGIEPALKQLKIGVENGHVTADDYAEALQVYSANHEEMGNATMDEAPAVSRVVD